VQQEGGYLRVHSTWVEKDELVYVFLGLGQQAGAVTAASNGFARLTDPDALAIQPVLVHVEPAPRSGAFEQVAADFPIPEGADLDLAGLAMLNGVELTDRVEQGALIKVLRRRTD
jgi:predicted Zn-dependent protease